MLSEGDIVRVIWGLERSLIHREFDLVLGKLYTVSEVFGNYEISLVGCPTEGIPLRYRAERFELAKDEKVLPERKKMKTKWTKELVIAEAQKYQKRSAFSRYSNNAYYAAVRMGILNDVCAHMPDRSLSRRYVADGKQIFVRYQNRKLYDVSQSKYVNLSAILKLPVGTFKVIDDKTKEDITNFILIQGVTAAFHEKHESFESIKGVLIEKNILKGIDHD
jgi:hypothetical protein